MFRTYTMRLKTTKRQDGVLTDLLEHLCVIYNQSLAERKRSWEQDKKRISRYDQHAALTQFRHISTEVEAFPAAIQRSPINRVDLAYEGFFRRVKSGEKPGYPRFKAKKQYNSFNVGKQHFRIDGDTIIITKLGGFRFKTRYKIKGVPKELRIQRKGRHWIANVVFDIGPAPEKIAVRNAIGIDLGIISLATLSDGTEIENPQWTKQWETRLAQADRDFSSKKIGSKNRKKSLERLRRVHQRIAGLRKSHVTAVAKNLFEKYDLIAHEKLMICNLTQSNRAKSIKDAAWGKFIWRLTCEAESAGKWLIPVRPHNTTKMCSGCGESVPKSREQRKHKCPACGLYLGRDHNAALNILDRGMRSVASAAIG